MSDYTERATFNPAFEKAVPKDAIVIEDWLPGPNHRAALLTLLRENYWTELANQIEAQTKPPRIPEPGLGSHVTAGKPDGTRSEFVRVGSRHWSEIGNGSGWEWGDLVDPVLVRPGVEDEQ